MAASLDLSVLPPGWDQSPPGVETQRVGDGWLASMSAVALRVPSAIVSHEDNVLINPRHRPLGRIKVLAVEDWKLGGVTFGGGVSSGEHDGLAGGTV